MHYNEPQKSRSRAENKQLLQGIAFMFVLAIATSLLILGGFLD